LLASSLMYFLNQLYIHPSLSKNLDVSKLTRDVLDPLTSDLGDIIALRFDSVCGCKPNLMPHK